ncbi:hypothetical protein PFTANZ_06702 [Plasmodium falciparum Tanzania (2000708)]|uniref:Duffy-binding-like domain-containing protein n=1 Tax=Plasmodium falciparum Tanzania (2000708) TaxID=1036725 RepID=A0A024VXD1_PLAFA|nr:hypothetical protein PFTANZ_06702 [Plasmodium falciparum Tanzania (2000708)]
MARTVSGGGGNDYSKATSAKDFLDLIGETVQKEVHGEAKNYVSELKGNLSRAKYPKDTKSTGSTSPDPCDLDYKYHTNVTHGHGKEYPCEDRPEVRFSDTEGAQCDKSKIKDNKGKSEGACAPYRRSSLCDHHLSYMNAGKTNTTDNLLLEVCLAALHEGDSLKHYSEKLNVTYTDSPSQLCTELARSFADIGDIVRGRDLYLGDNRKDREQREQLEKNLKDIFEKIHKEVTSGNKGKTNVNTLKTRYGSDENYYKLREDWWEENRETVWKAITCNAGGGKYFRNTCDGGQNRTPTNHNCRCIGATVPTYFDYVPQYLRWFEEWGEDFCRKKKKKVEKLEQQCRGQYQDADRYCDRNGFDCERTIYKKGYFVIDKGCHTCSVWCRLYESWIDNQKQEFLKQKQKYEKEIKKYENGASGSGNGRQKRDASTTKYEGYEKKFYEILKSNNVGGLDKFLEKLSNEEICTKITEKEGIIDFKSVKSSSTSGDGDGSNKTFYRSKYCEECPLCGVKKKNGNEWEQKNGGNCTRGKRYKIKDDKNFNGIDVLSFGDKGEDRETKLKKFCETKNGSAGGGGSGKASSSGSDDCGGTNIDPSLCEKWKCYKGEDVQKDENAQEGDPDYDKDYENIQSGGGLCILKNEKEKKSEKEPEEFQKTFNNFFYFWIGRFLNDSMYWREKVNSCINNPKRKKCKNDCEKLCGCFQRWIKKKKEEWGKIKEQFSKQDFGNQGVNSGNEMLGVLMRSPSYVLKEVLNIDELFKDIKDGYGNAKELEGIKKLLDEEKKREKEDEEATGVVVGVVGGDNENNTTIDKLLNHEDKDAKGCLEKRNKCPDPQPSTPDGDGVAKTGGPRADHSSEDAATESDGDQDEDEEEEEDEDHSPDGDVQEEVKEVEENVGEVEDAVPETADTAVNGQSETPAPATKVEVEKVKPCKIVETLFEKPKDFTDACTLKYVTGKNYGWRCVPSVSTPESGKSDGSICVPPRRRKLYVGKLEQWASRRDDTAVAVEAQTQSDTKTRSESQSQVGESQTLTGGEAQTQTSGKESSQSDKLRNAFIESAAIETFFLWDRYKKIKLKEKLEEQQRQQENELLLVTGASLDSGGEQTPEEQLASGNIPPDFLRQMFYTLGDYRDILVRGGGDTNSGSKKEGDSSNSDRNIVLNAGGDQKSRDEMQTIQTAISSYFSNSGSTPRSAQNGFQQRENLWSKYAEPIWNGMICALTYKETSGSDDKGVKIEQNEGLKGALLEADGNKPKNNYQYSSVTIGASGAKPKSNDTQSQASGEKTTLTDFISRPPYFRYLEEWGETFCRQRTRMLEQVETNCKQGNDKCSGYGENCKDIREQDYDTVADLECPKCGKHCRFYKKWIKIKKDEYDEQESAYSGQKKKYVNECNGSGPNKGDNGFCETVQRWPNAAAFLKTLGPCKTNNGNESVEGKTIFENTEKTFKHATNCKPCSQFRVNCKNGDCKGANGNTCNGETVTAEKIAKLSDSTVLEMRVSDDSKSATGFKGNGLEACQDVHIFKGIRKDVWTCGYVCGVDICEQTNINERTDGKEYIQIRALLKHWVNNFLEDYNKIRKKLNPCINNGGGSKCKYNCQNKCKCVKEWIDQKKVEWPKIRDRYIKQYTTGHSDIYKVTSFLEDTQFYTEVQKAIKPCDGLDKFKKSCGLNGDANEQNKNGYQDAIDCLLEKLGEKAKTCLTSTSGENQTTCGGNTHPDDEDLLLEETEENPEEAKKNMMPTFCEIKDTPKQEEKGGCDPATTEPASPPSSGETDKEKPEEEPRAPVPSTPEAPNLPEKKEKKRPKPKPQPEPPQPYLPPALKNAMLSSTIMWSIGIGFAAFTYFFLKVNGSIYVYVFCVGIFGYIYM